MTGEVIALASAALYALSGVSIARGAAVRAGRRGDNGAFLSTLLTGVFSLMLWAMTGGPGNLFATPVPSLQGGIAFFAAAGVFSTVLGRVAMFRSVEGGGAVRASMMRRLTPVFAAIFAVLLLAEVPAPAALVGMVLILAGTVVLGRGGRYHGPGGGQWAVWGLASAGSYGLAYVLRKMALEHIPDAAFGALVGALVGCLWYLVVMPVSAAARRAVTRLWRDTGRWQVITATAMALAQVGQFMALARTEVAVVAVIGSMETVISFALAGWVFGTEAKPGAQLWIGAILSTIGVVLIARAAAHS